MGSSRDAGLFVLLDIPTAGIKPGPLPFETQRGSDEAMQEAHSRTTRRLKQPENGMTWKQLIVKICEWYDLEQEATGVVVVRDSDNCVLSEMTGPINRAGLNGLCIESIEQKEIWKG